MGPIKKFEGGLERVLIWIGGWSALTGAFSWVVKEGAPFTDQDWNWAESLIIGVGLACGVSLAISAGLMAWRRFRPLSIPCQPEQLSDPGRPLPSRLEEIAKIAGEAAATSKATAEHSASINQGHLHLKRQFEDAKTSFEDRLTFLENETTGLRKQIHSHHENIVQPLKATSESLKEQSHGFGERLESLERYEEAKVHLAEISNLEKRLDEEWQGISQRLKDGDKSGFAQRDLAYLIGSGVVNIAGREAPLSAYYSSLSADTASQGARPAIFRALELYQRCRRDIDEGREKASKEIKAYEEERKRRFDPKLQA